MFCSWLATPNDLDAIQDIDRACFPMSDPQSVRAQPGESRAAVERRALVLTTWDGQPAGYLHTSLGFSAGELHRDRFGPGLHRLVFHQYSHPPDDLTTAEPEALSAALRARHHVTRLPTAPDGPHVQLSTGTPGHFSACSSDQDATPGSPTRLLDTPGQNA